MINSIGYVDGYENVYGANSNMSIDARNAEKQHVNDVVSIDSTNIIDGEIGSLFNNVVSDLSGSQTGITDLHGELNLDRVKALLSL